MSDDMTSYLEIKPEFNRCYDREFNHIFSIIDATEQKILVEAGVLEKVKNAIVPTLETQCEKITELIGKEMDDSIESAVKSVENPCPVNFKSEDVKHIKKLKGQIVALNGLVNKVYAAHKEKPYYEVALEGGKTIWIASLVDSGFEVKGKILRILGYVAEVGDDKIAKKHNDRNYHILALCVIDIMDSKQMAMMPGSELQIKEWIGGKIPKARK